MTATVTQLFSDAVINVLRIFPGAKIVRLEPTAADWAAIEEEAAGWRRDFAGVWHPVERKPPERVCADCSNDHIPQWRHGGKIVEITEANGRPALMCHYCGRAANLSQNNKAHESANT